MSIYARFYTDNILSDFIDLHADIDKHIKLLDAGFIISNHAVTYPYYFEVFDKNNKRLFIVVTFEDKKYISPKTPSYIEVTSGDDYVLDFFSHNSTYKSVLREVQRYLDCSLL
jgi:hypothetical protein